MNEKIKELAEEAGFIPGIMGLKRFTYFDPEKFAELVRADEREACAKVCEDNAKEWIDGNNDWCQGQAVGSNDCAAAIRARGEK